MRETSLNLIKETTPKVIAGAETNVDKVEWGFQWRLPFNKDFFKVMI